MAFICSVGFVVAHHKALGACSVWKCFTGSIIQTCIYQYNSMATQNTRARFNVFWSNMSNLVDDSSSIFEMILPVIASLSYTGSILNSNDAVKSVATSSWKAVLSAVMENALPGLSWATTSPGSMHGAVQGKTARTIDQFWCIWASSYIVSESSVKRERNRVFQVDGKGRFDNISNCG